MKRRIALVLLTLPLAASCSGFPISKEEALNVISSLEMTVSSVATRSYRSDRVTQDNDDNTTVVSIYSKESKFFHTYSIISKNNGRFSESWRFVMNYQYKMVSEDGTSTIDASKDFIFYVVRSTMPNDVDAKPEDRNNVSYEPFSEEAWKKYSDDYEGRLERSFSDALQVSKTLINDSKSEVDLKSFNSNSIHIDSKTKISGSSTQESKYTLDIQNGLLMSIKNSVSDKNYTETKYEYNTGDILYPEFKLKTPIYL